MNSILSDKDIYIPYVFPLYKLVGVFLELFRFTFLQVGKMSNSLRFKSMRILQTLSNCLGPYPIGWDKVSNRYYMENNVYKLIFPYMYFEYISVSLIYTVCGFILLRQLFSPIPSITILHIVFITLYLTAFSFFGISSHVVFHERNSFIKAFNFNLDFEINLKRQVKSKKWTSSEKPDAVGIVMMGLSVGIIFWGIFIIPCLMFIEVDPIYYFFILCNDYFPGLNIPQPTHPLSIIFRLVAQVSVVLNGFRTMLFVFLTFVLSTNLQKNHIRNIGGGFLSVYKINTQIFGKLKLYRIFYLLIQIIDTRVVSTIAATLLAIALNLEILSVFICLRMYRLTVISTSTLFVYAFWLCLAFLVLVIAGIEIPDAAFIYEETAKMIKKWQNFAFLQGRRRDIKLSLRSMRPARFTAGYFGYKFFYFRRSIKTTFFATLIYYVITSLLSAPAEHVSKAMDYFETQSQFKLQM